MEVRITNLEASALRLEAARITLRNEVATLTTTVRDNKRDAETSVAAANAKIDALTAQVNALPAAGAPAVTAAGLRSVTDRLTALETTVNALPPRPPADVPPQVAGSDASVPPPPASVPPVATAPKVSDPEEIEAILATKRGGPPPVLPPGFKFM